MENENIKKGIFFGIFGILCGGITPIIANSRPESIDAYLFAAITAIVQVFVFFPLMMIERKKIKSDFKNEFITIEDRDSYLYGFKKNIPLLVFAGISFGISFILFFTGYKLAGAINGSLILKTTIFFSLIFDWFLLHEKISIKQIIFSIVLFFGLFLAITQASFDILELNVGVLILLSVSGIWIFTHSISKPMLERKEITSIQFVCIRNFFSSLFLISTYFLFYPLSNINLLLNSLNIFYGILMGAVYGIGLYFWYKILENINVSKATIMISANILVTAALALLFLGEIFTIYHLIGTILIITSIIVIVNPMKKEKSI
ncbi:MAG: DMT family transporter [Promethearchaeota archaeon]